MRNGPLHCPPSDEETLHSAQISTYHNIVVPSILGSIGRDKEGLLHGLHLLQLRMTRLLRVLVDLERLLPANSHSLQFQLFIHQESSIGFIFIFIFSSIQKERKSKGNEPIISSSIPNFRRRDKFPSGHGKWAKMP